MFGNILKTRAVKTATGRIARAALVACLAMPNHASGLQSHSVALVLLHACYQGAQAKSRFAPWAKWALPKKVYKGIQSVKHAIQGVGGKSEMLQAKVEWTKNKKRMEKEREQDVKKFKKDNKQLRKQSKTEYERQKAEIREKHKKLIEQTRKKRDKTYEAIRKRKQKAKSQKNKTAAPKKLPKPAKKSESTPTKPAVPTPPQPVQAPPAAAKPAQAPPKPAAAEERKRKEAERKRIEGLEQKRKLREAAEKERLRKEQEKELLDPNISNKDMSGEFVTNVNSGARRSTNKPKKVTAKQFTLFYVYHREHVEHYRDLKDTSKPTAMYFEKCLNKTTNNVITVNANGSGSKPDIQIPVYTFGYPSGKGSFSKLVFTQITRVNTPGVIPSLDTYRLRYIAAPIGGPAMRKQNFGTGISRKDQAWQKDKVVLEYKFMEVDVQRNSTQVNILKEIEKSILDARELLGFDTIPSCTGFDLKEGYGTQDHDVHYDEWYNKKHVEPFKVDQADKDLQNAPHPEAIYDAYTGPSAN